MSPISRTLASGQNSYASGLCMSTQLSGARCMSKQGKRFVPYCVSCMKTGDPSLGVVNHPRFGKTLICLRALPLGYRLGLWGDLQKDADMPDEDGEWGFEFARGKNINPVKYPGSVVQFSQCPGPNERISIGWATAYLHTDLVSKLGCIMFETKHGVQKNQQLNMMYSGTQSEADSFFAERGLTRCDVYTPQYPTLFRQHVGVRDLITCPPRTKGKTGKGKGGKQKAFGGVGKKAVRK